MKLIREHIGFERNIDPKKAMGVGLETKIREWLKEYRIAKYELDENLMISTYNEVNLNTAGLFELPDYIKFNEVFADFHINWNNLHNLKNCPIKIYGSFWANGNPLTSLEGSPVYVSKTYAIAKACGFTEKDIRKVCNVVNDVHLTNIQREQTFAQLKKIRERHGF